jgi:hypothetical protein
MRWLARFLTSVCTFLALLTVGLWISSHRTSWHLTWEGDNQLCDLHSGGGTFVIERVTAWPGWSMLGISRSMEPDMTTLRERWGVRSLEGRPQVMQIYSPRYDSYVFSGGGAWVSGTKPGVPKDYRAHMLIVPYAWPAAILTIPALLSGALGAKRRWRDRLHARRRAKGLCVACGYDVRASDQRCPECGKELVR